MEYELIIHNKKVFDFYNENKHLCFEEMSCLMVDLLEKLSISTDTSFNKTLGEKVLMSINSLNTALSLSILPILLLLLLLYHISI